MMILRDNQGGCLRAGTSKQSPKLGSGFTTGNEAQRNGFDCAGYNADAMVVKHKLFVLLQICFRYNL